MGQSSSRIGVLLVWVVVLSAGCGTGGGSTAADEIAEEYVRLALAVGRHDENFIDAYYGPGEWMEAARQGDPRRLDALRATTSDLSARLSALEESARTRYLDRQLRAIDTFLRLASGETMSLSDEARLLYDIEPPAKSTDYFAGGRDALEALLPGDGDLPGRVNRFLEQFQIPADRLPAVVDALLETSRAKTAALVDLPPGERFRQAYVTGKPWGAYNWYQGDYQSLIEVNTDLPSELGPISRTIPHEGYPGHHTYNALLEHHLVRERGWPEYSVYLLYSPQSLIAEGTANAGVRIIFDDDELESLIAKRLAPIAGLDGLDFERYFAVRRAMEPFKYARGEAARLLLDQGKSDDEVVAFLVTYGLTSEDRARKSLDFIRTYRAYVYNYTAGEDLVMAYIGEGDDRVQRYFDLLQRPVVPSELVVP